MKYQLKFVTVLFFLCMNCFVLMAQQKHFIYVQSEDRQPFAVVLGGKVYSSSDYGYVIIPKLADSTYKFAVSFPMNKFPDQYFTCTVNKKDVGYTLKNANDGWALQNMQTQKLVMNSTAVTATSNAFGNMLSDVVNDSTLTKNNVVQQPVDTTNNAAVVAGIIPNTSADSLQAPQKIFEQQFDTGTNMLFVDKTKNGVDTINVFVPNENVSNNNINNATTDQQRLNANAVVTAPVVTPAFTNNDSSVVQNNSAASENVVSNNNEIPDTATHAVANPFYKPGENNNTVINSNTVNQNQTTLTATSNAVKEDCGNMISDEELNKLKRKMFVQNNNNDMVQYAVKYLNKKCITTGQVKDLGNLFSSDDGRYSLYDALYSFTYDYGNYPLLASQILDPYYKKRFAAMLR
ncbi:MAG: DUF4476 domain-containing protein [Parafilimonas sp.]|nr:DUF4476 domain-containing protein [Parafilimonas sp.]